MSSASASSPRWFVQVNDVSDENAKLSTSYEPKEIQFFRQLVARLVFCFVFFTTKTVHSCLCRVENQIEEILQAENGSLSSMDALNLQTEVSRSKKDLELLCKRFLDDQWLMEPVKVCFWLVFVSLSSTFSLQGVFSLGPRGMLELSTQLKLAYADLVEDCRLCQSVVVLVCIFFFFFKKTPRIVNTHASL
jgi:hypothetical protein